MKKFKNILIGFWQSLYRWPVLVVVIVAFILGLLIGNGGSGSATASLGHDHGSEPQVKGAWEKDQIWTCSMHPQIRQLKPGKCPICGMDLIPVSTEEEEVGSRELKLSPTAIKLADIQTVPVERRFVSTLIRMVGKVEYDESRLGYITSRVPGRIDRLYVDYTGITVRKGDHLVYLYSPELISAQQELLQALKVYRKFGSGKATVTAARGKLKLWGLPEVQIKQIEKRGTPLDHLTVYSPMSGIVIHKDGVEGMYVNTGTKIYTIADLSRVWVKMDAYESDLSWLRYGQKVEFETEAYPGETFTGRIAFIDPVLNPETRTVKVRVNVSNQDLKLKPEMFVRAVVRSKLSVTGKVLEPELAGKWISPMHPEIIKDKPGTCDICGMPLVKAEKLGYMTGETGEKEAPLVIPASAPLITGKRAVVYVTVPGKEGVFAGKEIVLGPRAGDYYLVKKGLREGERVVVNGAFKIDSDLQIQAKPSMMNPEGGVPAPGHHHHADPDKSRVKQTHAEAETHGEHKNDREKHSQKKEIPSDFKQSIKSLTSAYLDIQKALSGDDFETAKEKGKLFTERLSQVDMTLLSGNVHSQWMKIEKEIKISIKSLIEVPSITDARSHFSSLSDQITYLVKHFGSEIEKDIYLIHCPMALDNQGAYWLQDSADVKNPYFGSSMLKCHDSRELIVPKKKN